jgi:hypothetical protein
VQGTRLALYTHQIEMGFRANVNIHVQPLQGCFREDFLANTRWQIQQLTGLESAERDEPASSPHHGHLLEWSATLGALALHFSQHIVIERDQAYVLTATAPAASFAAYRPDFQMVFESFTLVPEGMSAPDGRLV